MVSIRPITFAACWRFLALPCRASWTIDWHAGCGRPLTLPSRTLQVDIWGQTQTLPPRIMWAMDRHSACGRPLTLPSRTLQVDNWGQFSALLSRPNVDGLILIDCISGIIISRAMRAKIWRVCNAKLWFLIQKTRHESYWNFLNPLQIKISK